MPADHGKTSQANSKAAGGTLDWLFVVLPGLIWGASFLFIAEGLTALAPNGVTFTRILIGFVTLSLVPAVRKPVVPGDRLAIAGLGVLWFAFPLSMFPFAEQRVSSALTGMLNGATPLVVTLVASLLARRMPTRATALGLIVGLGGGAMIALPDLLAPGATAVGPAAGATGFDSGSSLTGIVLILIAIACYGVAYNLARPLQQRNGSLPVVWRAMSVGLILTAPLGIPDLLQARWSLRPALALLALGALGTAVANVLAAEAAGRLGATRASAIGFIMPVVALILGMTIRHEHVATLSIAGCAVCLIGAWLIQARPTPPPPATALPSR